VLLLAAVVTPACGCRRYGSSGTELRDVRLDWQGRSERLPAESASTAFERATARERPWTSGDPMTAADEEFQRMRERVFGPPR
jgi:hypothetical protein